MHGRVIGHTDDQPSVYAGIGKGKERVGGDIEADMFHGAGRAGAAQGSAESDFAGHLFIWRPFAVNFVIIRGKFRNFRRWCSRIAGNDRHARFIQAAGNGFIAEH